MIRSYQALVDGITVTVLADRGRNRPQGLLSGGPGAPTEVTLYRRTNGKPRKTKLPVKVTVSLSKGDTVEIKTAGGGGYGKPSYRSKSRVKDDIENEIISRPFAKRAHYLARIEF